MKKITVICIFLLLSNLLYSQANYTKFPDCDVVVEKFFNNYSVKGISAYSDLNFEKRPTGWHITLSDRTEYKKRFKDELFWSLDNLKFEKIDFFELNNLGENLKQIGKYKNIWGKRFFRICPYYGYPLWDWDVIQEFKDVENLPDSILYALGRAYSSYAGNLLNNNSGLADKDHQFKLPAGKNSLTNEQLKKYRYYRHLAIKTFNKVAELNPNFETKIGSIMNKASNEYLTSFLDLRIYQNEKEANKEIIDDLYSNFSISTAKNYLNSCDSNAILFTSGDNDTYPLLYVQSKYGFRTDVLVVNISLLQTERYIYGLREQILNAPKLPISLTIAELKGKKREIVLLTKAEDTLELNKALEFVKNDENKKNYGVLDFYYLPSNKFSFNHDEVNMVWEVNKNYILRSELMLIDLLATNKWERPIYFTVTMSKDAYFGLDNYFQLEGLAYKLTANKKELIDYQSGVVETNVMYRNLINKFEWSGIESTSTHQKLFINNVKLYFHRLAEKLILENKFDSAKVVLNKCIKLFPNKYVSYDYQMIQLIEDYYKISEFELGNKIAEKLAYNLNNSINLYTDSKLLIRTVSDKDILKYLENIVSKYNQKELIPSINK